VTTDRRGEVLPCVLRCYSQARLLYLVHTLRLTLNPRQWHERIPAVWLGCLLLLWFTGCSRFHPVQHDHVYVAARQVYLHDRVAAVSNRVGLVTNGEALEVVERGKRFVKVRTPKGEVGWIEDHAIIDDKLFAQFQELNKKHANDPVAATAQLRDDLYLHVGPGRDSPHFLLIAGNAKVQLLARGSVPKKAAPGLLPPVPKAAPKPQTPSAGPATKAAVPPATVPQAADLATPAPAAPILEDWWLVRDSGGNTGWLLAGRLDVDVPDEVGGYAEGQRMVGAYPIAKVTDYGVGLGRKAEREAKLAESKGSKTATHKTDTKATADVTDEAAESTAKEFTEYVTVLSPPRGGLPYDFDQVRVFTWSLNHHRYETAYRLRGIQGYLPVKISQETVNGQTMPTFSFEVADGPNVTVDPDTGVARPATPRTLSFRLEGNLVRRTGADQAPIVPPRNPGDPGAAKSKAAAAKKKKH
jgi:Bacterial SH3 domain